MVLDCLPEPHLMLAVLGLVGIVHEIFVGKDRGLVVDGLLVKRRVDVVLVDRTMFGVGVERHGG
jgi:hypothetical protein